jgi:enterochelin esterase-like enzyme
VGSAEAEQGVEHPPSGMRQDIGQRESVTRLADPLRRHGIPTRFSVFEGAHDPACWAAELPAALAWITATGG